jgi:hypothetical protein
MIAVSSKRINVNDTIKSRCLLSDLCKTLVLCRIGKYTAMSVFDDKRMKVIHIAPIFLFRVKQKSRLFIQNYRENCGSRGMKF